MSYLEFINNKYVPRSYVSIYTLIAEQNNTGNNWQKNRMEQFKMILLFYLINYF